MSSNSTDDSSHDGSAEGSVSTELDQVLDEFWLREIVLLAERLGQPSANPTVSADAGSTWQQPPAGEFAFCAGGPLHTKLSALWQQSPEYSARIAALVALAERIATLNPEQEGELSSQLYVMF
jgi:hypothetical protein